MALKDAAWHDRMYNNRALVPDFAEHFERWKNASVQARQQRACVLDVAYGDGPNETLDIFPASRPGAPVVVFIHGGYWQRNSREGFAALVQGAIDLGWSAALPGYTLSLSSDATTLYLNVTLNAPATAWWHNRTGNAWNGGSSGTICWATAGSVAAPVAGDHTTVAPPSRRLVSVPLEESRSVAVLDSVSGSSNLSLS